MASGSGTRARGFAAMDEDKLREIASMGGRTSQERGTAHVFNTNEARKAGRKGGRKVSRNREHMAEIGRKGGRKVSRNREHMAEIGRRGGASSGYESNVWWNDHEATDRARERRNDETRSLTKQG